MKIAGRKRHIVVDMLGQLVEVVVHPPISKVATEAVPWPCLR
jgi:hypothetical protein